MKKVQSFLRYCVLTLVVLLGIAVYSSMEIYEKNQAGCNDMPSAKEYSMYSGLLKQHALGSPFLPHDDAHCIENFTWYDARKYGVVPRVRQRMCDACWAYAAIGVLECSYLKLNKGLVPVNIDFSEKQLLVCAKSASNDNSCKGNLLMAMSYLYMSKAKIMSEQSLPENGFGGGPCPPVDATAKLQLQDWGMVDPDRGYKSIASVAKIKEAICRYGPVAVSMSSTDSFTNFSGNGVFFERRSNFKDYEPRTNHVVIIVGWDERKKAWLVRNCWGEGWGQEGYAWVSYITNNIGASATWVVARKTNSLRF